MRCSHALTFLPATVLTLISEISALPPPRLQFSDTLASILSPQTTSSSTDLKSKLKPRMLMPDSPPPPNAPPPSWRLGTALPVSYRVAIAIDAFVLLFTILSLILLGLYIKRQYTKRKTSLLHGHDAEFGFEDLNSDEDDMDGKEEEAGLGGVEDGGERRKKGHVRWTSSVVGMGPVGVRNGKVELEGEKEGNDWGYDPKDARGRSV